MPEGHVIHRLTARLLADFAGYPLEVLSPQGRFASSAERLQGLSISGSSSWGKHIFLKFGHLPDELAPWLHVHLGLYGKWRFYPLDPFGNPPPVRGEIRLRLVGREEVADLSGPTRCAVISYDEMQSVLGRLGPDPLVNNPADRARFVELVRARKRAVGELVMDQSVVAGPGNIYRAECLFRVGISPFRKGANVSVARLGLLWDDLRAGLLDGLETGLISTMLPDDLQPLDAADPEAQRFYVYHRTGRPCIRCGTAVAEAQMQNRRLFWCPGCQR